MNDAKVEVARRDGTIAEMFAGTVRRFAPMVVMTGLTNAFPLMALGPPRLLFGP